MNYDLEEIRYIVSKKISKKRYVHTLGVAEMSKKLAKLYGADIKKCYIAALLHDICKEESIERMKRVCKKFFYNELSKEDFNNTEILHGFVASHWVREKLKINDEEILSAIKYHTIGHKEMSLVEKIVYIADGIEMGRKYPGVEELRKRVFENLNRGILYEIEKKEKFLESIGKKSHKNTIEFAQTLKSEIQENLKAQSQFF